MNNRWYILRVRGGMENNIIQEIHETLKRNSHKEKITIEFFKKEGEKNLISGGYIFVNCSLTLDLLKIIYTVPGVISFLNHTKKDEFLPEPLSAQAENEFLGLIKDKKKKVKEINDKLKEKKEFQINDSVEITKGTFRGCRGKIAKIDNVKGMVTIEINFLGRLQAIDIPIKDCVEK